MRIRVAALTLLAALAVAACDRPAHRDSVPPLVPGTGLGGGLSGASGIGMTGTFPSSSTATQASGAGPAPAGIPDGSARSGAGNR